MREVVRALKKVDMGKVLAAAALGLGLFLSGFFLGRNYGEHTVVVEPSAVIPLVQTGQEGTSPGDSSQREPQAQQTELVNVNTASVLELQTLPGVGTVLAQRIVDYRMENGPFYHLSELTLVEGIGEKKLEQLRSYATIGEGYDENTGS